MISFAAVDGYNMRQFEVSPDGKYLAFFGRYGHINLITAQVGISVHSNTLGYHLYLVNMNLITPWLPLVFTIVIELVLCTWFLFCEINF